MNDLTKLEFGVSFGTLMVLGLTRATSHVAPTTAHFLFGDKCTQNCAFCAQANKSLTPPGHLSRITWPKKEFSEIWGPLEESIRSRRTKRICIQMTESAEGSKNALSFLRRVRQRDEKVPISVCMAPFSLARVRLYFEEGASRVGLPIDAASREIYESIKGGSYEKAWEVLEKASQSYPRKISTHLIGGLGEREKDMVAAFSRAKDIGVKVALFAFTPVRGTSLSRKEPPSVKSYRRVQLAHYFIENGGDEEDIVFEGDRIAAITIRDDFIKKGVTKGKAFETSGCPDCNRPYYNERPNGPMMNYPRTLRDDEVAECLRESNIHLVLGGEES